MLDPPLRQAWSISTHGLIEFPPAIAGGVAYLINKYGNGKAVRLSDRKVLWELKLHPSNNGHQVDVTGPAYADGRVFGAFLDGYVAAGDAASGRELWVDRLHAHLESSPLAFGGRLYLGTDTTDVICLRASDGRILWRFNAPGAIKASPSYDRGRIFVADYESSMFALEAKSGKPVWRTNTSRVPPFGEGGFFSSPAIGFGRVYAARDDGVVSPSTSARARSTGPSRPAPRSTARLPSPASPARRRPSTSAPKTAASTRSTPSPASRAGTTTSAARSRARRR